MKNKLEKRAFNILKKQKQLYSELDSITAILKKSKFKSGQYLILIDNFKNKNVVFRTTSVRRFELKSL